MKPQRLLALAVLLCVAVTGSALAGCSASSSPNASSATMPAPESGSMKAASNMAGSSEASGSSDMSDMACGLCASKGNVPAVNGEVKIVDGVQVVEIGIKDNTYNPNTFAAKAGMPVKVVFTGMARNCLAKPTFPALKKTVDIGPTGKGTIELGELDAGTYELTCGMESHGGSIVVE